MRGQRKIAATGQHERSDLRIALVAAPFVLLGVVLFSVKTASSSASYRIDDRVALENLKLRIAQASASGRIDEDAALIAEAAAEVPAANLREVRETVKRGDTLGSILRRIGLASDEITRWSETMHRHVSLAHLTPGHRFTFLVPSGTDHLSGLQYEVSPESTLVMRADGDDITAQVERLPRMVETRLATGVIESSLYAAAARRGVPDSVVSNLVDIFGWEIDFSSDLQAGDTFRVLYEQRRDIGGKSIEGGKVLAAELVIGGKRWDAIYFEADDDGGGYYTPQGDSFGRSFLRYPVEFTRISSQFTSSRFHPLLGINRPHLGVDFAAPMGTPVRAIAAGRVEFAGWHGGSGRYIRIDHGSNLESSYSHLQSIVPSVRPGSRVQVGQVIGRVGASGLATGPHLHFAFYRGGVYVNPMTAKLPASPPLAHRFAEEFAKVSGEALHQLASASMDGAPTAVTVASVAR
jgi:murein DD-endopeptidase MepM/ murein hydrolase activator NlpD